VEDWRGPGASHYVSRDSNTEHSILNKGILIEYCGSFSALNGFVRLCFFVYVFVGYKYIQPSFLFPYLVHLSVFLRFFA